MSSGARPLSEADSFANIEPEPLNQKSSAQELPAFCFRSFRVAPSGCAAQNWKVHSISVPTRSTASHRQPLNKPVLAPGKDTRCAPPSAPLPSTATRAFHMYVGDGIRWSLRWGLLAPVRGCSRSNQKPGQHPAQVPWWHKSRSMIEPVSF